MPKLSSTKIVLRDAIYKILKTFFVNRRFLSGVRRTCQEQRVFFSHSFITPFLNLEEDRLFNNAIFIGTGVSS